MQIERKRDSEQIREISIQFVADDPQYEITRTLYAFWEGIHKKYPKINQENSKQTLS